METFEDHLKYLHNKAIQPFFEKSKHKCFLTQKEFENDYGAIMLITHSRRKIEETFKKLNHDS